MLYLTYLYKIKELPDEALKFIIMRKPPQSFDKNKYNNVYIRKDLSPLKGLLKKYKQDNDWLYYEIVFNFEMRYRRDMKKALKEVADYAKNNDIFLICCEKDYMHCHRYLEAKYLEKKYNTKWREY